MSAVDANSDDKKDETHVMRPALSVFTTADQSCAVAVTLCSKNKDKKSESNSQLVPVQHVWLHSVPSKASSGTEYAYRAQKGFLRYATHFQKPSVLKTGFWGTEGIFGTRNPLLWYGQAMCTGKDLLMYRMKRRKAASALRSVILRKTAICMLLLLPLNSRSQLWTTSNYR